MKPLLTVGYTNFLLKDQAHLQTVLKVLADATVVEYDSHRSSVSGKCCYCHAKEQGKVSVELIDERRVRPSRAAESPKPEPAIEPEIVEDEAEQEAEAPAAQTRRRPRTFRSRPKLIDFAAMRRAIDTPRESQPLLLGPGGAA